MSHFTVLVIGDDVEKLLAPYHEFECTGQDDEFVQDVDRTEEALAKFEEATITMIRKPDGSLTSPYNEEGNYKPQFSELDPEFPNTATRRKLCLPYGCEKVEALAKDHESPLKWIGDYYGWHVLSRGGVRGGCHKFGFIEVDGNQKILRCIDRTNPNAKWDWYQIGGRWSGYFKTKFGVDGKLGERSLLMSDEPPVKAGRADQCRKADIDILGMRDEAEAKAKASWAIMEKLVGDMTGFETWEEVTARYGNNWDAARNFYHGQPQRVKMKEAAASKVEFSQKEKDFLVWGELDPFAHVTREQYLQTARDGALVTFAVIKDSQWYERGEMGWWACVAGEKKRDDWHKEFSALIDGLPDDAVLTVVDCHI